MRIFTYILAHDGGFAPNPFHRLCTLACCKPQIRRSARPGDWVIGITPKRLGHRLAYAMEVEEILALGEYFEDPRFANKMPDRSAAARRVLRFGDNCYRELGGGQFSALPSVHNKGPDAITLRMNKDLRGKNVLIASRFSYFGANAQALPPDLAFMIPGRGHRVRFSEPEVKKLERLVTSLPQGLQGPPRQWPEDDVSWRSGSR